MGENRRSIDAIMNARPNKTAVETLDAKAVTTGERDGHYLDEARQWRADRRVNPDRRAEQPANQRISQLRNSIRRQVDREILDYLEVTG